MSTVQTFLLLWLIGVSLALFIAMGADKRAAKRHSRRVPENSLLALAILGGSVGGILGMLIFRHKTKKPAFYIGYPAILLAELALTYFLVLRK